MDAATLLKQLQKLRDEGVPLEVVQVLVTVNGYDYITQWDYLAPTEKAPTHELYLAIIEDR